MIWKIKKVCEETGLCKSTIYRLIKEGAFMAPIKLTSKSSGWDSGEVLNWIEERKSAL